MKDFSYIDDEDLEDILDFFDLKLSKAREVDQTEEQERLDNLPDDVLESLDIMGKSLNDLSPELQQHALNMASTLILKFVENGYRGIHPLPTYRSEKYLERESMLDFDLERTVAGYLDNIAAEITIYSFKRNEYRNPVLLLLDTSYSMAGVKLIIAGLTVGILAQLIPNHDLAIIGFNKDVFPIKKFEEDISPFNLITRIMKIKPTGGTNLTTALEYGDQQIRFYNGSSKMLMLSDADPTLGRNPLVAAKQIRQLDLLLFPDANEWVAKNLISAVGLGSMHNLHRVADVPVVLKSIFSSEF